MKFKDIRRFPEPIYAVDVDWKFLEKTIKDYQDTDTLELNPDFQRGHVWTEEQQRKYVEFCLKGGKTGNNIYLNHPSWREVYEKKGYNDFVCVDGLQRLTAIIKFMNNELAVFDGHFYKDFGRMPPGYCRVRIHVNNLKTKKDVLKWYLDFNDGGTVHSDEELERVRKMLGKTELKDE
jgi:hypothetical protein